MNSNEIYKNYLNTFNERTVLENRIENLIERWKNKNTTMSSETIQQTIDKGYKRLEELKKSEEKLHTEYMIQVQKEKEKNFADISIQHNLEKRPTNIEITGGTLSNNPDESYLIGKQKTQEQLESERAKLLSNIKSKVMNHEISLAEASKLTNDINIAYGFYNNSTKEKTNNEIHR